MATNETYISGQLYPINLNELLPDPDQPRKYMDPAALTEMVDSVKEHGVIQPPTFRIDEGGLKYIMTGERRCTAARMAGLAEIAVLYTDNANYDEISLVENILRSDLTAVEEAEAMDRLMKKHKFSQDDLVKKFSKSKATISSTLSITKLPQEVLDDCRKNPAVPKRVLIEIAQKRQTRSMATAYQKYKDGLNPRKKRGSGVKTSAAQSAFDTMDVAGRKINNLDVQSLTHEERDNFSVALDNLKQIIESKFQAMAQ
ncbi:MAG: ParB/RepB/Spo0J family partition protein [Proteobacteria bacterium]|nr:ParB/RepB/Spo0J family partition protein [Pseudomonadota bacterium]MCG2739252.1 ParB/RepB/Spo0J family partition protein [Syntrophaceae bacterium]